MGVGDRVMDAARRELGVHESPWGSNSGQRVRQYQAATTLGGTGWPWCGAFAEWVYKAAGVNDDDLAHQATSEIAVRAYRAGAVVSYPVVGGMICWPGTHVALIEKVYNRTTVGTIGGNEGDAVRRNTRSNAGAIYIAPRAIRQGAVAPPDPTRIYGFQDPKGAVLAPGSWRTKAFALNARRKLGTLGRRAKVTKRGGKWRILMPAEYRYISRKDRDRDMALRGAETGRRMRPISRTVTTLDRSQVVTQGLGKVI
jgi:hypothetical protein